MTMLLVKTMYDSDDCKIILVLQLSSSDPS